MWKIFGNAAAYVVCVNSIAVDTARAMTGDIPKTVRWRQVSRSDIPPFILKHLDKGMPEEVGWKFAPVRLYRDCHELALDNDCILWRLPEAMGQWLADPAGLLIAEDVCAGFGQFAGRCYSGPRNSGIHGLPPGLQLERVLQEELTVNPVLLKSELDEQGLQIAALERSGNPYVINTQDVSICSVFPQHMRCPGRSGAHFVGLNARQLPWTINGRSISQAIRENWDRWKPHVQNSVCSPL